MEAVTWVMAGVLFLVFAVSVFYATYKMRQLNAETNVLRNKLEAKQKDRLGEQPRAGIEHLERFGTKYLSEAESKDLAGYGEVLLVDNSKYEKIKGENEVKRRASAGRLGVAETTPVALPHSAVILASYPHGDAEKIAAAVAYLAQQDLSPKTINMLLDLTKRHPQESSQSRRPNPSEKF